jgi:hypothetical protein
MLNRRHLLQSLPLLATGLPPAASAQAAPWPSRPIRIVTPISPGGSGDVMLREFAWPSAWARRWWWTTALAAMASWPRWR